MSKTALGVFFGIIGALVFLHLYRQYRLSQLQGKPFDIWSSLFSPLSPVAPVTTAKYVYKNKKCYLQSGTTEAEVDLKNCYSLPELATDLVSEYNSLASQISSMTNPNDPANVANVTAWTNRQNDIIAILKEIKGCAPRQGIDVPTLTCI